MSDEKIPDWLRKQERSHAPILRLMVWISLTFGRRIGRWVLRARSDYPPGVSPQARRASRAYLGRALGREATWGDGYRHVLSFASTVHDRVYLLNDRFDEFEIDMRGEQALYRAMQEQPGALLIGGHLGSFEVLRATGRGVAGLKVAMLMYKENAAKLNATLAAINPAAMEDIIPLGRVESMLEVRDKLDAGYVVGMLVDRSLGGDAMQEADFLGQPARFPVGPWRMAALLRRPVFCMTGRYLGGNRYQIHFEPLADFSHLARHERDAAIAVAIRAYADCLTRYCRLAPYNWFNFFDFWRNK